MTMRLVPVAVLALSTMQSAGAVAQQRVTVSGLLKDGYEVAGFNAFDSRPFVSIVMKKPGSWVSSAAAYICTLQVVDKEQQSNQPGIPSLPPEKQVGLVMQQMADGFAPQDPQKQGKLRYKTLTCIEIE